MSIATLPVEAPASPDSAEASRLKIVIVGHVDHGKSTLIGRIFFDTHSLPDGKVESIRAACEAEGMEFEFAFLLDALLEEQEQNITIDTTQIPFRTKKRNYVIIDAPGHKEFLKNMITGAASAHAAVLVIDAHEGVQEQSRRHAYLLSLLGIRQVVVAVNKMDLVGYEPQVFDRIQAEYTLFLQKLGVTPSFFVPLSARAGENVASRSEKLAWYSGPTILEALDAFETPASATDQPLRLVLQDIYRFDERRILAGRVETGKLKVGDEIVFWPDRKRSRVRSIEDWNAKEEPAEVEAGRSTAITLEEQIFVERGQIGGHAGDGPAEGREFHASLFWIHQEPLPVDQPFTLKLGTQEVEARMVHIERVLDSSSLDAVEGARHQLQRNEVGDVKIRTRRPIAYDRHDHCERTGRFVVVIGKRIGGGGIVRDAEYRKDAGKGVASDNITWTIGKVTRESRAELLGHRGAVIWLTGLSGSGKSTLAIGLEALLHRRGMSVFILDGDNLRHGLCADLKFSAEDRSENIRRAAEVAKLMAEAGVIVICSLISPFRKDRSAARDRCDRDGLPFAEIFVDAPLSVCEARDPRGLYRKARAGEITGFTGIDSPYEPPEKPELVVHTGTEPFDTSLHQLYDHVVALARMPEELQHATGGAGI